MSGYVGGMSGYVQVSPVYLYPGYNLVRNNFFGRYAGGMSGYVGGMFGYVRVSPGVSVPLVRLSAQKIRLAGMP